MLLLGVFSADAGVARSHRDVWLKNEQGDRIIPRENGADPYSPRKTCGGCHNYELITSGYHFQQGFDQMSDGYDEKRPWILSPGMFGKWLPTAGGGRLAAKNNTDFRQIDLTTYDWIGGGKYDAGNKVAAVACGWCHPGGGPLEYGRDARGKADKTCRLIAGEKLNKETFDGDYSAVGTPDKKSHFRESGVVEADCLLCHRRDYCFHERNEQLTRRNYRWAATAGAGLGKVTGSIFNYPRPGAGPGEAGGKEGSWNFSKRPVTAYDWANQSLFAADGRMKGELIKKTVAAKNCLQCHGEGEAKNTGGLHDPAHDVHVRSGFVCTDCHGLIGSTARERLRHQLAKGNSPLDTVRDDLDHVGMKTCTGCHHGDQYKPGRSGMPKEAKNPQAQHRRKFSQVAFHTYLVTCNGCHAVAQPARGMVVLDMSTGRETGYAADDLEGIRRLADYAGLAKEPWKPWITRRLTGKDQEERYAPGVPKAMQWFGEKQANGGIRPIPLRYVEQAAKSGSDLSSLQVKLPGGASGKQKTVVKDKDIMKMIEGLSVLGFPKAVFVADRIYSVNKGRLAGEPLVGPPVIYGVGHGVTPLNKKQTYGAPGRPDGCGDCHSDRSAFFNKMVIRNIRGFLKDDYPVLKGPNALPQYLDW
jgi:hypothetical protein